MQVNYGDMWNMKADARCVTTNGHVNRHGLATMGRGVALDAATRYPDLRRDLANNIRTYGNELFYFPDYNSIFTFPVKHVWNEPADLLLIEKSCRQLAEYIAAMWPGDEQRRVLLPKPGCGNGQLDWETVEPILDRVFGSNPTIVVVDLQNIHA